MSHIIYHDEGSDDDGSEYSGVTGDTKEDFLNCLENITAPGSFAKFKQLDTIVDPAVKLGGSRETSGERIGLPLSKDDAQKIIQAAHRAPFGRGTETVVDTSVRNTWELNPDQFSLGERWQPYVNTLAAQACYELGVDHKHVRAELYKMLLYEKGAMFKPHADSEKTPGMFGTLVISLTSDHTGGTIVFHQNKQRLSFQTEKHEYMAWLV